MKNGWRFLYFHKFAVEHVLKNNIESLMQNKEKFIKNLLNECSYFRKGLQEQLLGQQHRDLKEIEDQISLNLAILTFLEKLKKEYIQKEEE